MTDRRTSMAAELESGLSETLALFQSLSPAELHAQVYSDGNRWTVRQGLAHFIAIEGAMHKLFRDRIGSGSGSEGRDSGRVAGRLPASAAGSWRCAHGRIDFS